MMDGLRSDTPGSSAQTRPQRASDGVGHGNLLKQRKITVIVGAHLVGVGPTTVVIKDDRIVALHAPGTLVQAHETVDATGQWLAPAFIDSHVHLLYLKKAKEMAEGGIAAAVDHAAPLSFFETDFSPLDVIGSGPMVTAVNGYPTQSWGSGGYGWECADPSAAIEAVTTLHGMGARLIKLPITSGAQLNEMTLRAAVRQASKLGLPVSSHALNDAQAWTAAKVGADLLAHTPVQPLGNATVQAWADRAVVSSLKAFGGSQDAVDNLSKLAAAGTTILYGTDFGNSWTTGIDGAELELMAQAGMTPGEILRAGTDVPAAYWGFDDLGSLDIGKKASILFLDASPRSDASALANPARVMINGEIM